MINIHNYMNIQQERHLILLRQKMAAVRPLLFLEIVLSVMIGCAPRYPGPVKPYSVHPGLADLQTVKSILYQQVSEWKGVPYRNGGLSKKGVDCSGFVYLTYASKFDIKLPRSTKLMARIGTHIAQKDLKAGDLVFFKTGFKDRHVGIYLEKNRFAHASTNQGVTISRMNNAYWSKRYWKAVRITN